MTSTPARRGSAAWCAVGVALLVLAACSSEAPAPAPAAAPTVRESTALPPAVVHRLVLPAAAARLPATWREAFVVRYGDAPDRLGTSGGGDAGGRTTQGPEYGAPAPDGSWWFLDQGKKRLAHYDATGHYLGAVTVPRRLLVRGRYFQWQLPHVLADGTLVAVRQTFAGGAALLRLRAGHLDELPLRTMFAPSYDDGRVLYGATAGGSLAVLDPATGDVRPTADFLTPGGAPFSFDADFDRGTVTVAIGGATHKLVFRTVSGKRAFVGGQVRAGSDGSVHLLLIGVHAAGGPGQLVGYLAIGPRGELGEVEPFLDPSDSGDPGGGDHLVLVPGSSTPMVVLVRSDGVHVYARR